jgi:1-acyl-sn-glycerol-3-phosphate acyltransferase
MKSAKPWAQIKAVFSVLLLIVSTTVGSIPVLMIGLLKLIPNRRLSLWCTSLVDKIAELWTDINNTYLDHFIKTKVEVTGGDEFQRNHWHLVIANHQSWLDIVMLQRIFNRKIPVLKFFIKDELKWIPFLGFSWWAMGCPFMKRYSPAFLAKHPHKRGQDIAATKKALTLFKETPTTLMSFVEGTRFSHEKQRQQSSPYQHLLKPKAGGVSFVISAMDKKIDELLDVTIIYPTKTTTLWHFLCDRILSIKIHIRKIPIPAKFLTPELLMDNSTQEQFREWLNQQWLEKDFMITKMQC